MVRMNYKNPNENFRQNTSVSKQIVDATLQIKLSCLSTPNNFGCLTFCHWAI